MAELEFEPRHLHSKFPSRHTILKFKWIRIKCLSSVKNFVWLLEMFSKTDMAKFELVVGLFDVPSMETVGFNLFFLFADKESTTTPDQPYVAASGSADLDGGVVTHGCSAYSCLGPVGDGRCPTVASLVWSSTCTTSRAQALSFSGS